MVVRLDADINEHAAFLASSTSDVLDDEAKKAYNLLQAKVAQHTKTGAYANSIGISQSKYDRIITIDRDRWGNIEVGFVGRDGLFKDGLHLVSQTLRELK